MIGHKTLGEIRAELEKALAVTAGSNSGRSEVMASLERFLRGEQPSNKSLQPTGAAMPVTQGSKSLKAAPTAEL